MATRPCKPGADVKGLWQLLLPDVPMPSCGTQEKQEKTVADASKWTAPQSEPSAQAKRRDGAPARRE